MTRELLAKDPREVEFEEISKLRGEMRKAYTSGEKILTRSLAEILEQKLHKIDVRLGIESNNATRKTKLEIPK